MERLYNIYFTGELLEGQELSAVRQNLARLFKANEATLDKLFSGTAQLVKRECDKATALKYKQAMEQAGARPVIKVVQDAAAAAPEPAPAKPLSAAERIAALASAPDKGEYSSSAAAEPRKVQATASSTEDDDLDLEAPGADVLKPEERAAPIVNNIDTSALDVDTTAQRLSEEPPAPPPSPDTSHLSMGGVGEDIPTLPSDVAPLSPDIEGIALSPEGTDFTDCAPPDAQAPEVDLSALDVAPQGSDVLEDKYRNKKQPPAPATGHISLED